MVAAKERLEAFGIPVFYMEQENDDTAVPVLNMFSSNKILRIAAPPKITDEQLSDIATINTDMNVNLRSSPMTDQRIALLKGRPNIHWLQLSQTPITDEGIKNLAGMDLYDLDLSETAITDAGLAALANLKLRHLKNLNLERTKITDAGLKHLENFSKLEFLGTTGSKVTQKGMKELKRKLPDVSYF